MICPGMINFDRNQFKGQTVEFTLLDSEVWIPKELIYKISDEFNPTGFKRTDVVLHNGIIMECNYNPGLKEKAWGNGK